MFKTRDKFSDYLPFLAYDEKTNIFINNDSTYGIAFECTPLYFSGSNTTDILEGIINYDYGKGAILQIMLYADTNIQQYCSDIKIGDVVSNPILTKMNNYYSKFINDKNNYLLKTKGNSLKNFRFFIFLKTYEEPSEVTKVSLEESLISLHANPRIIGARELISLMRQLLNGDSNFNTDNYDEHTSISKQIINADSEINFQNNDYLQVKDEYIKVITPKSLPDKKEITELDINELLGSWKGEIDDLEQIPTRFIINYNIILDRIDKELEIKNALMIPQKLAAKKSNNIGKRTSDIETAVGNLNESNYLRFIPSIVLFSSDKKELATSANRVKRLWKKKGFIMQFENYIHNIVFMQSLPFCLYNDIKGMNLKFLDRHFIAPSKNIAALLPVSSDFNGGNSPIVPLVGRKGQVQGLDFFAKNANNHNFICAAETGSGKSFTLNWIISHYFAKGTKIRLVDIGGSYKRICSVLGGEYLDIGDQESTINFNPFQTSQNLTNQYVNESDTDYDEVDKQHDIDSIVKTIGAMIYSTGDGVLSPEEHGLVTHAVKEAVARGIVENGIDFIQNYLTNLDAEDNKYPADIPNTLISRAKELSFNLCEFSSKGEYGKYFNQVSQSNWQDNNLVVLELEELTKKPPLLKVVMLQVITMMTMEMYNGDRTVKKMLILEEMSRLIKLTNSSFINDIAEDAYRRARKYNGSIGSIFQSITDTEKFGVVGVVMLENSAYKLFLQSTGLDKAIDQKIISYSGLIKELLVSIKSKRPHYSELFIDTPSGCGVSRLMVDPYGYAIATTDADEATEIDSYQQEGMPIDEALEKFAIKRGLKV